MNNDIVMKIIKRVLVVSLLLIGISFFIFKDYKSVIYGYIFGMLISILGFKLLHTTINRAVEMSPKKAMAYSTVHYMLRYLIYFVVLSVAALADYLNFLATILGLMMVKFTIIASGVFDKDFNK